MTQSANLPSVSANAAETGPSKSFGERVSLVAGFLRRRYLSILIGLLIAVPLGGSYLFIARPIYTASVAMMIETRPSQVQESLWGSGSTSAPGWIETQIGVLRSGNVLAYVAKQLRLVENSEFLSSKGSALDRVLARLGWENSEPKTDAERAAKAIGRLSSGLSVHRLGQSYMVQIDFAAEDPKLAEKIANAMIDGYIYEQLNAKYQSNRRAGDWLQERLQALREQTSTAERAVIDFKAKNNIVVTTTQGGLMSDQQVGDMSAQLAKVRAHTADIQIRLNRIQAVRKAYREDATPGSADETVTEEMSNAVIGHLRSRYLELMNRAAEWSVKYGENHNAVVNVRGQIRAMRSSIRDELGRIEETYKSELQISQAKQDEAEKGLNSLISKATDTNQAQVTLFSLEAAAKSYRKLYDNFLQQYTESVQQQSFPISNARSLSSAVAVKTAPNVLKAWMLTAFGGIAFGVGLGFFRELMDSRFRTKEHIQALLQTECLAMVPLLTNPRAKGRLGSWRPARKLYEASGFTPSREKSALITRDPLTGGNGTAGGAWRTTPFGEAIETMKLGLELRVSGSSSRILGLTSSYAGEGKSTLAMGLAAELARDGSRVVLVDCDLRNPRLSRHIAPDAKLGLLQIVESTAALGDVVRHDLRTGVSFIPAVLPLRTARVSKTPINFLSSDEIKLLFQTLQIQYDYVIVDLPPLASSADVRAATRFVDGFVLVVEWGRTKVDAVQYALRHAPEVSEKIIGTVLNKVDYAAMSRYDNYGARYYYGYGQNA